MLGLTETMTSSTAAAIQTAVERVNQLLLAGCLSVILRDCGLNLLLFIDAQL